MENRFSLEEEYQSRLANLNGTQSSNCSSRLQGNHTAEKPGKGVAVGERELIGVVTFIRNNTFEMEGAVYYEGGDN